jgi:hypothetical protein
MAVLGVVRVLQTFAFSLIVRTKIQIKIHASRGHGTPRRYFN